MVELIRILSRATAKPFRTAGLEYGERPYLNENGHVDFEPDDVENPHCWSNTRRWYVTVCAVLLVVNATFASSAPSGCFSVCFLTYLVTLQLLNPPCVVKCIR